MRIFSIIRARRPVEQQELELFEHRVAHVRCFGASRRNRFWRRRHNGFTAQPARERPGPCRCAPPRPGPSGAATHRWQYATRSPPGTPGQSTFGETLQRQIGTMLGSRTQWAWQVESYTPLTRYAAEQAWGAEGGTWVSRAHPDSRSAAASSSFTCPASGWLWRRLRLWWTETSGQLLPPGRRAP